jgi:hypothetical protein
MSSLAHGSSFTYLVIAVIILGLAFAGIVWVGRTIRGELGVGATGGRSSIGMSAIEQIPPAMMKEAIAKGLVVPSQLAGMTEMERTFLFASIKQKLAAQPPATEIAHAAPSAAPVLPSPRAPEAAPKPQPAAMPPDVPPAMLAILNADKLRVWCPMCGTELQLPTFPPLVARCTGCGMKSAVRAEEGGRYVVNVAPPPKLT